MVALKTLCIGCIFTFFEVTECFSDVKSNGSNLTICEQRQNSVSDASPATGYVCAFIAIFMFGSNFLPVKKINTGDGVFFQWIVCLGIWTLGLFVHLYNGDEAKFYPLVMVGGALWCTGNMCVVPVIKAIGLAMGLLIWGTLNLLAGWATGRFGTFGLICEQPVKHSALNYVGVMLALISLAIFMFIKSENSSGNDSGNTIISNACREISQREDKSLDGEDIHLLSATIRNNDSSWVDHFSIKQKRVIACISFNPEVKMLSKTAAILSGRPAALVSVSETLKPDHRSRLVFDGIFLSVLSGIFYGISFVPMYVVQKNNPKSEAPDAGIQYVFSQFCGTLLASTVYFLIYCLYKRNKPDLYPEAAAPAFLSGILWAVGNVGWFVANTNLSESVSFPIVTTGPGIIASVWGIFIFHEIKGWRNFLLLGIAICFAVSGSVVTGFSK